MIEVTPKGKTFSGFAVGCEVNWVSWRQQLLPGSISDLWQVTHCGVYRKWWSASLVATALSIDQESRNIDTPPLAQCFDLRVGRGEVHAFVAKETSKMKVK